MLEPVATTHKPTVCVSPPNSTFRDIQGWLETGHSGSIYTISFKLHSEVWAPLLQQLLGNVTSQQNAQACLDLALACLSRLTSHRAPRLGLQAARPECPSRTRAQGLHLHPWLSPRPAFLVILPCPSPVSSAPLPSAWLHPHNTVIPVPPPQRLYLMPGALPHVSTDA